ncbi:sulfite exporter TauE/SafE family protein [Limosilactobacillus caecicola]|uniref:sulfite exporter TauE/SafE family protein n=1 Tax=Limosilactobacillus caecicola TaxID=2941332 RepID=UPI00203EE04E|nr:sulfite exporter TauE/SafE family protein [Limosilactobacillus caecicola]
MILKIVLGLVLVCILWLAYEIIRHAKSDPTSRVFKFNVVGFLIGVVTDFGDTLGIGSFGTTPPLYRLTHYMPDERYLPGTLNAIQAIPTMMESFFFITAVPVELPTLIPMVVAAVLGSYAGSRVVARWETTIIQKVMAIALTITSLLMLANKMGWIGLLATHNNSYGLHGWLLVIGIVGNFIFGILMSAGVGLYAPCMVLVYLLGMKPIAAFPIMMLSCALLMPAASYNFIREDRVSYRGVFGFIIGGILGVYVAATFVKSLPMHILTWLIVAVCLWTAYQLYRSAKITQKQI